LKRNIACPTTEDGEVCSNHGSCDDETGKCNCDAKWGGTLCEVCALGYYGPSCDLSNFFSFFFFFLIKNKINNYNNNNNCSL